MTAAQEVAHVLAHAVLGAAGVPMPPDDPRDSQDKTGKSVYEQAKNGGRHSGFYKQHANLTNRELERGINSLQKQIDTHRTLMRNPEKNDERVG